MSAGDLEKIVNLLLSLCSRLMRIDRSLLALERGELAPEDAAEERVRADERKRCFGKLLRSGEGNKGLSLLRTRSFSSAPWSFIRLTMLRS